MPRVPDDAVLLVSGLVGHIRQIVGDGASYAMLHYGAVEEGKRLGAGLGDGDILEILGRIDSLLGHRTDVLEDAGGQVRLRVSRSAFLETGLRPVQGIVLGLVEGALSASRRGRFKGHVLGPPASGEITLELRRDGWAYAPEGNVSGGSAGRAPAP